MKISALVAEMIGTFFLCFAGIAAILSTVDAADSEARLVVIALAHGLAISIAVSVFGGVSGGHINPAVTIGMLVTGRISLPNAIGYIMAQCLGGYIAALCCLVIFPEPAVANAALGIPLPAEDFAKSTTTILLTEFILTYLLVTAVFGTAVDQRGKAVKIGALAIGLTVTIDILAAGGVTGASMNPARSFGPAAALLHWEFHWMYWAAPVAGAITAAMVYQHVILNNEDEA